CGYCKFPSNFTDFNCPSYNRFRFESYSTGGRLWLIWAWSNKEIEWSDHLAEIVFSCNTCRNCVEQCPMKFSEDIIDWIIGARSDIVEKGLAPPSIRDFLDNIYQSGNPWGMPRSERDVWAEGIKHYTPSDEYLFYVGCTGSYEERGQRITRTLSEVLTKTGISFGILGAEEECDGNEVYMLGEIGLFRELAKKNVQKFKDLSVKKIFTLSPHAYNSMKNKYSGIGDIEIRHYTHLLHEMIQKGKIGLSALNAKVTYHDPCFLGRYNGVYAIPRDILKQIPGVELVEMERNRENSFCCGGGGGNFVFDLLGRSRDSPSRIRVREAHKTGAEILVVACPNCMTMFDDAIKAEGLDGELAVKDISELVKESIATFK
ncbi:MAG: (Fe-S)-binding protein, partial [Promethearchaeota archaeon]